MSSNRKKPPSGTPSSLIREFCKNNARVEVVDFLFQTVISEDADESTMSLKRNKIRRNCSISDGGLSNLMDDLQTKGLIVQDEDEESNIEYRVTESGNVIFEDYFNLLDKCETMADEDLQQFLNEIPNWDEVLCDPGLLDDASIVTLSESGLNQAREKYSDLVKDSSKIRELVHQPFVPGPFEENEKDLEFILSEGLMENMGDSELISNADYLVADRDIPYTLSIFDEKIVGILPAMESDPVPNMFLYTENKDVLEWAQQRYDGFSDSADFYRVGGPED